MQAALLEFTRAISICQVASISKYKPQEKNIINTFTISSNSYAENWEGFPVTLLGFLCPREMISALSLTLAIPWTSLMAHKKTLLQWLSLWFSLPSCLLWFV